MPNLYPELLLPVHDTLKCTWLCSGWTNYCKYLYGQKYNFSMSPKLLMLRFCHLLLVVETNRQLWCKNSQCVRHTTPLSNVQRRALRTISFLLHLALRLYSQGGKTQWVETCSYFLWQHSIFTRQFFFAISFLFT